MRTVQRILVLSVLLVIVPWLAQADSGPDDLEHNRLLLEQARKDPEHYGRLHRDLLAFLALPEERQQQMRRLDRALREEDSAGYARLQGVLERYADWLQSLPEADRQLVISATSPEERLKQVRNIRERQWIQRLPQARRKDLEKLQAEPEKYRALLATLKEEERTWREKWRMALTSWDVPQVKEPLPEALQKLQPQIQHFVSELLAPMLNPTEKARLEQAHLVFDRDWRPYFNTLVALADRHPVRVPPAPKIGPVHFQDLPSEWQIRLKRESNWPPMTVNWAEGKWPDYAFAVHRFAVNKKLSLVPPFGLPPLGPSRPSEFTPAVQKFIKDTLLPVLTNEERIKLRNADGRWPGFANHVMTFAKEHQLHVPGTTLPGSPELWDRFRRRPASADASPDVPDQTLRQFMQQELTAQERTKLPSLSLDDPASREQIRQMFLERNPQVRDQLKKRDQQIKQKNKTGKN